MKLNTKRTILVGLAFLSICTFWQFYDNEIPRILKNTFNLGETVTGVIMALDNVLALFLLPLFGSLSDHVHTRIGKRMPFILGGTIVSVTLLMILTGLSSKPESLVFFIIVLLCLLVAMGTYRSPAVSLMPDVTPAPMRSKANAIINLMGTLGGVFTLLMIKFLVKAPAAGELTDYFPLTIAIGAVMLISVLVLFLTVHENKIDVQNAEENKEQVSPETKEKMPADVKKSMLWLLLSVFLWFAAYNAVTTAFSRYVGIVWGLKDGSYATCLLIANIAAIISYLPIGFISEKIGRKRTILIGICAMALCFLAASFVSSYHSWIVVFFALIGFGWAAINVNSYPMVVQMAGHNKIGKYTGTYYTFSMAAQVFTPIFSGFLLEYVSYRTLFPYAFVFSILALLTMSRVKYGDVKLKN
jgi:Na+/melibiose symporter-like transporter